MEHSQLKSFSLFLNKVRNYPNHPWIKWWDKTVLPESRKGGPLDVWQVMTGDIWLWMRHMVLTSHWTTSGWSLNLCTKLPLLLSSFLPSALLLLPGAVSSLYIVIAFLRKKIKNRKKIKQDLKGFHVFGLFTYCICVCIITAAMHLSFRPNNKSASMVFC